MFLTKTLDEVVTPELVAPNVSGVKRSDEVPLVTYSKRINQLVYTHIVPVALDFEPALALPSKEDALVISPVREETKG